MSFDSNSIRSELKVFKWEGYAVSDDGSCWKMSFLSHWWQESAESVCLVCILGRCEEGLLTVDPLPGRRPPSTIPILLLRGVQRALLLHTVAHALIRLSQHVPLSVVSPSRSPCRPAERTVSKTHWVIGTVYTKTPFQPLSRYLSFFFLFPCFSSFFVSN